MIKPEEVRLLVESIKQNSGTEVPADAALAALYELEQYRYRARSATITSGSPPARTALSPKAVEVTLCQHCKRPMRIIQIQPIGLSEFRTYECLNCKRQQALVVKRA